MLDRLKRVFKIQNISKATEDSHPQGKENEIFQNSDSALETQGNEKSYPAELTAQNQLQRQRITALEAMLKEAQLAAVRSIQTEGSPSAIQQRETENLATLGRMSAQVAHEVRNPLHSIGLEAELAVEVVEGLSSLQSAEELHRSRIQLKQSLLSIQSSVDRLEKIVGNYLKLSKLSRGDKRPHVLANICQEVISAYAPLLDAQKVELVWKFENPMTQVYLDADLLEQALGNLVKNAIQSLEVKRSTEDFTFRPQIKITTLNSEKNEAVILVEDNGTGLKKEIAAQLFQPFVTSKAQGTGLGLAFVKKVIEEFGGKVTSEERVECGASFRITLPVFEGKLPIHLMSDHPPL